MIDISTQAPVAQTNEGTASAVPQNGTSGASGFLRLFEIILGGMPQGGQIGSVAALPGLSPEGGIDSAAGASGAAAGTTPGAQGALALLPGGVATPAGATGAQALQGLLAGVLPATSNDPFRSLAGADGSASAAMTENVAKGLGSGEAKAIADVLRQLGFDVEAADVASLGELDQEQLAAAMEFLQRGVQAGLPTDDLLENASCLMPREWSFDGGRAQSAPRVDGLASTAEEGSGIDPAQVLAGAEAVRRMLQAAGDAMPSNRGGDAAETADAAAEEFGAPGSGAGKPTGADWGADREVAEIPVAPAPKTRETTDIRKGITIRGEQGRSGPESSSMTESGASSAGLVPAGEAKADAKATPFHAAFAAASKPTQTSDVADATSAAVWGAKAPETARETTATTVSQGVRAGSMASEFIGRQVLEKVDVQLKQGRRELNVRLWPEELGEVRLSLRLGDAERIDARIVVQTESVRQAILDATPQLREALSRHGMEMGRLSVNIDSGSSSSSGENLAGNGRGQTRDDAGRSLRRTAWQDEEVEFGAALALGVDSGFRDGRNTLDMWS